MSQHIFEQINSYEFIENYIRINGNRAADFESIGKNFPLFKIKNGHIHFKRRLNLLYNLIYLFLYNLPKTLSRNLYLFFLVKKNGNKVKKIFNTDKLFIISNKNYFGMLNDKIIQKINSDACFLIFSPVQFPIPKYANVTFIFNDVRYYISVLKSLRILTHILLLKSEIEYLEIVKKAFVKNNVLQSVSEYLFLNTYNQADVQNKVLINNSPATALAMSLRLSAKKNYANYVFLQGGALIDVEMYMILKPDYYFVSGSYYKKLLEKKSVRTEIIKNVGTIFHKSERLTKKTNTTTVIGLATSGVEYDTYKKLYDWVLTALQNLYKSSQFTLLIKFHPSEKVASREKLINHFSKQKFKLEVAENNVRNFLGRISVLVHFSSTLGIEALINFIPSIDVHYEDVKIDLPYHLFNISLEATNPEQMENCMKKILLEHYNLKEYEKSCSQFRNQLYCCFGVKSAEKINEILEY